MRRGHHCLLGAVEPQLAIVNGLVEDHRVVTDRSSVGGAAAAGGVDYQALVGAYMAVRMLGETAIPPLWELPVNVVLTRLWAESGAPVDDVLVTTSATGHIFIQAKRTVGISDRLDSTLGEAFQQFVKLYLTSPTTRERERAIRGSERAA